jgi:hypothetical protein
MRGCQLARLDPDQLRQLVGGMKRCDHSKRPGAKTAFVCRTEDDANVMRLQVAYAEASGYWTEMAVFGSVAQAQHWLAED